MLESEEGYQRVRTHWVFDVKADGTWKARFVAGGDTVDSYGVESSMTMVRSRTIRIMFTQAARDMQRTLVGDLGNAYLHSYTEERLQSPYSRIPTPESLLQNPYSRIPTPESLLSRSFVGRSVAEMEEYSFCQRKANEEYDPDFHELIL